MQIRKSVVFNFIRKKIFVGTPLECLLKKFVNGAKSTSWKLKLLPNHDLYPANSHREIHEGSRTMSFNLGEWMEWAAYFAVEDPTQLAIEKLLNPGDTVIDVGSNIGSMILSMSKKIGNTGYVIGFEPSSNRYDKCKERLEFKQIKNAEVHLLALGAKEGFVQLGSPDPSNLGRTRVLPTSTEGPLTRCTTLDLWLNQQSGQEKINFIKIDVEGFEYEVIKGMKQTIFRFKPILFIEIDDMNLREQGSNAAEVLKTIQSYGYRLSSSSGGDLTKDIPSHFDLVAIPLPTGVSRNELPT
jgi:FkbM family methyltransferase